MTDVERDKDQDSLSRTAIHAEGFGFTGGFVFGADASTNTGGPDPDIDGLRGRGKGLRFGVIGWTEKADGALPAGGLAGVVGSGHNSSAAKDAAGVAGFSNSHEGVFGWSSDGRGISGLSADASSTSEGVFGMAQKGPGVKGHSNGGGDGVVGEGISGRGVSGTSTKSDGVAGFSSPGRGVVGSSDKNHGVHGESRESHAVFGDNLKNPRQGTAGCYGVTLQNAGVAGVVGLEGIGTNNPNDVNPWAAGVYGSSEHHLEKSPEGRREILVDKGFAGFFWGPVVVVGNFLAVGGFKSGAVRHKDGSHRLVYSMESPETWFEDFGEAKLVRGKARVKISPDFAAIVDTKAYYVFLTPHGDSAGLFVAARRSGGFEVREQGGGTSSLSFAYRVVAHPRQSSDNKRLAKIKLPPLPRARG
jgi:hypothetical protein